MSISIPAMACIYVSSDTAHLRLRPTPTAGGPTSTPTHTATNTPTRTPTRTVVTQITKTYAKHGRTSGSSTPTTGSHQNINTLPGNSDTYVRGLTSAGGQLLPKVKVSVEQVTGRFPTATPTDTYTPGIPPTPTAVHPPATPVTTPLSYYTGWPSNCSVARYSYFSSQAATTNSGLNPNVHLDAGSERTTPLPPNTTAARQG